VKGTVHLATVVGCRPGLLPQMLSHYRSSGISSLLVGIHAECLRSPVISEIESICEAHGATISAIYIGRWYQEVNPFLLRQMRHGSVDDWFVIADVDEFQVYPTNIPAFLDSVEQAGADYVEGCLVDRLAKDGAFPKLKPDQPVWEQFPLAGTITYPLLQANMLKVVAAKGFVKLAGGQHIAGNGTGFPRTKAYIPVHHFKWSKDVVERLTRRARLYEAIRDQTWVESQRFLDYYRDHDGKIDTTDPRFYLAESSNNYPRWDEVSARVLATLAES